MSQGLSLPDPGPRRSFQIRRKPGAAQIVAASGLPAPLCQLVTTVTRRCRLWRSERADVARELCGHFAEGLSRGATVEELIGSFGEPRQAARLITLAKKRCRPLWWKAARDTRRGVLCLILLALSWYGYHAARFYLGTPTIRFSAISKINEPSLKVPLGQRAWPVYREAYLSIRNEGDGAWPKDERGHISSGGYTRAMTTEERTAAANFARSHQSQVAEIRRASSMSRSGFVVSRAPQGASASSPSLAEQYEGEREGTGDGSVYGMLLPQLAAYRQCGRVLVMDTMRACEDGDGNAAVADVRALIGISRHASEDGTLISQMVGLALLDDACIAARELAMDGRPPLSEGQLVELMHALSAFRVSAAGAEKIDTSLERLAIEDLLQRTYTEGRGGNGHLTAASMRMEAIGTPIPSAADRWLGPALSGVVADRKEMKAAHDRVMGAIDEQIALPLWRRNAKEIDAVEREVRGGLLGAGGAAIVADLTSGYVVAQKHADTALSVRDATVAGLACELYKRRHLTYPTALADLVPTYLPDLPTDRWSGRPLRYRPDAGELDPGRPLIYSTGYDKVDDGGEFKRYGTTDFWQGKDWALWPVLPPQPEPANGGPPRGFQWSWMGAFWGR